MPKPMICLSDVLRKYLDLFRPCFSRRQWKYFVTVLLGLVECDGRATLQGLRRTIWEAISLSGLSRFLSRWPWSPAQLVQQWQADFYAALQAPVQADHARQRAQRPKQTGRPKATSVIGYLILDDSAHTKPKGQCMEGLGRHYSSGAKRKVPGHSLFTGLYVLLGQRCPLEPQLYRQKEVCAREGVPFHSKVDLAVATMEAFAPAEETHTHVLVDAWYHCQRLRRTARQRGWDLSGGLKKNRLMRPSGDRQRPYGTLAEYAATLTAADWEEAVWPAQNGGHLVYVHAVSTWVHRLGPTLVLITRLSLDEPLDQAHYWGSTLVDASAQEVIEVLAIRWNVEVLFEIYKDLLGSDDYQVMSATALLRFWTLVSCLTYFLERQRGALEAQRPEEHISCGEIRRLLQAEHRQNLLRWLVEQIEAGVTVEQLCRRLAA